VTNSSGSPIAGPLSLVLAGLPSNATLTDRNGTAVCSAPIGSPYVNLPLAPNNRLAAGKSTQVALQFRAASAASITFTGEVAGPGAR